jgi:hypothetical protein
VYNWQSQCASGIENGGGPRLMRTARLIRSKTAAAATKTTDQALLIPERNEVTFDEIYMAQPLEGVLMTGLMIPRQNIPHGVRYTLR